MREIERIVGESQVPGTRTTMEGGITRPAFAPNPEADRMLQLAREAGAPLGLELPAMTARAGSDGNFTGALGVPTLDGLGPQGANSCSRDEYVLTATIPQRAAPLASLISGLPGLLPPA
jgi:glutamate carboxypeptidase